MTMVGCTGMTVAGCGRVHGHESVWVCASNPNLGRVWVCSAGVDLVVAQRLARVVVCGYAITARIAALGHLIV